MIDERDDGSLDRDLALLGVPERAVPVTTASQILARATTLAPVVVATGVAGWRLYALVGGAIAAGFAGGILVREAPVAAPVALAECAPESPTLAATVAPAPSTLPTPPAATLVATAPRHRAPAAPSATPTVSDPDIATDLDAVIASIGTPRTSLPATVVSDDVIEVRHPTPRAGPAFHLTASAGAFATTAAPGSGPLAGPVASIAIATPLGETPRAAEIDTEVDVAAFPGATPLRTLLTARAVAVFPLASGKVVPSVGWSAGARVPLGRAPHEALPAGNGGPMFVTGPALDLAIGEKGRARARVSLRVDLSPGAGPDPGLRPLASLTLGADLPFRRN